MGLLDRHEIRIDVAAMLRDIERERRRERRRAAARSARSLAGRAAAAAHRLARPKRGA